MHADYTDANIGKPDLKVEFVASDKAGVTSEVDTGNFNARDWILPTKVNIFNRTGAADSHGMLASHLQALCPCCLYGYLCTHVLHILALVVHLLS